VIAFDVVLKDQLIWALCGLVGCVPLLFPGESDRSYDAADATPLILLASDEHISSVPRRFYYKEENSCKLRMNCVVLTYSP